MPKKPIEAEHPFSFRATETEKRMLEWLHEKMGLSRSALLKLAIRRLFEKEGGNPGKQ